MAVAVVAQAVWGMARSLCPDRERATLVKDVEIVSMMTYFEIWDKERWAHFQRDNAGPLDDLRERLASKGV